MGLVQNELEEVRKSCEHLYKNTQLISCVEAVVRIKIKYTEYKNLVVCFRFPQEYPGSIILIELNSKTLSDQVLKKLHEILEEELKNHLGKPQILVSIKFLSRFIENNPLIVCYDEINLIKSVLTASDSLKLRQKTSTLSLKIVKSKYYLNTKILVPDDYPKKPADLGEIETNLPDLFKRYFVGQAKEIARQCVEASLTKFVKRKNQEKTDTVLASRQPFVLTPSVDKIGIFLVKNFHRVFGESCLQCYKSCFTDDPENIEKDEAKDGHIERLYCGHLFHLGCLIQYMKTPPFQGGKKCPKCGEQIYHDKWRLSDRLAECRWAQEQARNRELLEAADLFN